MPKSPAKEDLVTLSGYTGEVYFGEEEKIKNLGELEIFSEAYFSTLSEEDFDFFTSYVEKNGKNPSGLDYAKCTPNFSRLQPGIEIRPSRKLFDNWGKIYYFLMDNYGMDYTGFSNIAELSRYRKKRDSNALKMSLFLGGLYQKKRRGWKKYAESLVSEISKHNLNPDEIYSLHVLTKDEVKYFDYSSIDLSDAIKKGIKVDIDFAFTNKLLGFFATCIER